MTEYAARIANNNSYFETETEYLGTNTDPTIPYRRLQGFSKARYDATLVKREGTGDWEPVNGLDQYCIGLRAKHQSITKKAIVDGYGWARCTCGWQDEESYESGMASHDFEAAASRHIADVEANVQRFRELLGCVRRTPIQQECPHSNDETRDHLSHPGHKEWRCLDCDLYIRYDIAIAERNWLGRS